MAKCWRFMSIGYGRRVYKDAILYLPHDGVAANNVYFPGKRYRGCLRDAGFTIEPPVKSQGRGATVDADRGLTRRLGPQLWFNGGDHRSRPRDALGFPCERKDDVRNVGLGPEHDWSSHAADALGLMAICYEAPGRAGEV